MATLPIPVLDASLFTQGTEAQKLHFANDLMAGFKRYGFVKLINHEIPEETVAEVFNWSKKFFKLSAESKKAILHPPGPDPQRGYSALGTEKSAPRPDFKDSRENFDQGPASDLQYPNRWPSEEELPGFRTFMESYFTTCESIALYIMSALELAMGLPAGCFHDRMLAVHGSELRLNRYPEIDIADLNSGTVSRIWPHTDIGIITLLFQDGVGGLEIEDPDNLGHFEPVVRQGPTEMVVNISATLQRWSNDTLHAGVHQVTIPQGWKGKSEGVVAERYSVAYLAKADRKVSVGTLPEFVTADGIAKYKPISALEFQQERLSTAY
ncbi:putative 2-oxoglutarate-dependent dioxygenase [Lachnellula hyalina]|uniref:Putative 2-oxoglutarate-dependent dioxygenase n=1 Tax=Lachnellula hyalina TaxID=1316788 RepID=A0A8H8U292_9HELO|nr:putative 2-oxoglutarate-dependent dioxygenase [Lachnellula hyalina]TVY30900.1 putative 2-oxoglutarate-dependent dioxygenase [Lachnellula hyalina]